jgi:hypothetical protein
VTADSSRPVVIGTYQIEHEAELARAILEAHGVRAVILRDNAGGMLASLQLLFQIRLVVAPEDADIARQVLDGPVEGLDDE